MSSKKSEDQQKVEAGKELVKYQQNFFDCLTIRAVHYITQAGRYELEPEEFACLSQLYNYFQDTNPAGTQVVVDGSTGSHETGHNDGVESRSSSHETNDDDGGKSPSPPTIVESSKNKPSYPKTPANPPPRKRPGRPRKDDPSRKRPGRPRKANNSSSGAAVTPTLIPKKRGRPRRSEERPSIPDESEPEFNTNMAKRLRRGQGFGENAQSSANSPIDGSASEEETILKQLVDIDQDYGINADMTQDQPTSSSAGLGEEAMPIQNALDEARGSIAETDREENSVEKVHEEQGLGMLESSINVGEEERTE